LEGLYRVRVGDYRVLYLVDTKQHVVTIARLRHRREAYR
jgi:mRNA interferase RelE/StbE